VADAEVMMCAAAPARMSEPLLDMMHMTAEERTTPRSASRDPGRDFVLRSVSTPSDRLYDADEAPKDPACPGQVIARLNRRFKLDAPERAVLRHLDGDDGLGAHVDASIAQALRELIAAGWSEADVVLAFWLALLESDVSDEFARGHRRGILRATHQSPAALGSWMKLAIRGTNAERWSWLPVGPAPAPATAVHP
jgi:hypothetical protein